MTMKTIKSFCTVIVKSVIMKSIISFLSIFKEEMLAILQELVLLHWLTWAGGCNLMVVVDEAHEPVHLHDPQTGEVQGEKPGAIIAGSVVHSPAKK